MSFSLNSAPIMASNRAAKMHKTILITGATDGIGRLTAQKLANDGHKVLLHGRSKARLEEVAEQIGGA